MRGVIPDELIDRPKQGFGVPVTEWLLGSLGERVEAEVAEFCAATDVLDRDTALRYAKERRPEAWYLLNVALWWKEFVA